MIRSVMMPSLLRLIRRFAVATHAISLDRSTVLRPRPERRIGGHQPPHRARSFRLAGFERRSVLSPFFGVLFAALFWWGGGGGHSSPTSVASKTVSGLGPRQYGSANQFNRGNRRLACWRACGSATS